MTRIDFYILPETETTPDAIVGVICRLCDKAVAAGQRVYVYSPEVEMAETLDGALWAFRQGSFISHERLRIDQALQTPLPAVLIGSTEPPDSHCQVMIDLGAEAPAFFSRFERVLEPIHGESGTRTAGRLRYKFYRDRGYPLATHELASGVGPHNSRRA